MESTEGARSATHSLQQMERAQELFSLQQTILYQSQEMELRQQGCCYILVKLTGLLWLDNFKPRFIQDLC